MSKLILSLGAIVALTAIFVIPSAFMPTHVAKASQCSVSIGKGGITDSSSATTSGSCSGGSTIKQGMGIVGADTSHGGSKSSCTAALSSQAPNGVGLDIHDSNSAVSCSSHSP